MTARKKPAAKPAAKKKANKPAQAPQADRPLTPKQERFVQEYMVDLNATQAAIRAGYSARNADKIGSALVGKTRVRTAISAMQERRAKRTEIDADRVVAELAKIGFANMADYMRTGPDGDPYLDFSTLTRDQAAALTEVTVDDFMDGRGEDARSVRRVKFKLADKRAALVDLGKHLGLFVERIEHTGKGGGPMQVEDRSTARLAALLAKVTGDVGAGK